MYSDDESDTSSEDSSVISSIDSDSSDNSVDSDDEAADDEVVAVRKIKMELLEILSNPKSVVARRLNIIDDPETVDLYINGAVNIVKNFDRLENYNTGLVVMAACYDMLYRGVVNDKNVADFVSFKITDHTYDPIDIIRYVNFYVSKK